GSDRPELLDGGGLGGGGYHRGGRRAVDPSRPAARRRLRLPRSARLPLAGLNPLSLARTLPGAIGPTRTSLYGGPPASSFSVNGQRFRGNNYLLDSTENNDFAFTGIAQPFNIADAVEEVVVQTGNFGVEFGRAGGGIFNVVTKSGTNRLHGTLLWRYQSQR